MINLGVVFGGKSVEHDISVLSYFQALNSLDLKKYKIIPIYFDINNNPTTSNEYLDFSSFKNPKRNKIYSVGFKNINNKCYIQIKETLKVKKKVIDCFLVIVHGKDLEDGTISSLFKILNVPYTSLDNNLSSVLHDKYYLKLLLNDIGINTVPGYVINNRKKVDTLNKEKIIKCTKLGSSIGVYSVKDISDLNEKMNICLNYDEDILVEDKIENFIEYNQAVYIKDDNVLLSAIEEVKTNNDIYSFDSKYINNKTVRIINEEINKDLEKEIINATTKIAKHFNLLSVVRIDYIYDLDSLKLYVNEINVIPGSLSYYLFEHNGIYFSELLDDIIDNAFKKHYFSNQKINVFKSDVLYKISNKLK